MLRCRQVVALIGSDEWRTAPLRRRFAVRLHLAMCRHCRAYAASLRRIGAAARRLYRAEPPDAERSAQLMDAVEEATRRHRGC